MAPDRRRAIDRRLIRELLAGNIYINVHTAQYPAGEIRGQVRPGQLVLTALESLQGEPPTTLMLAPNYPNPFRDRTTITFALPQATRTTLAVYNLLGQRVTTLVNGFLPAGRYQIVFDAASLPAGLYQYRLETPYGNQSRTLMHLR